MATRGPDRPRLPTHYPAQVGEIVAAQKEGAAAAQANRHVSACPYRVVEGMTDQERERAQFLQLMWSRAFRHAQAEARR